MDIIYEDDAGLWDELSHQQSREIEQHRQQQQLHQPLYHHSPTSSSARRPLQHHNHHGSAATADPHPTQQYPLTNSGGGGNSNWDVVADALQRGTHRVAQEVQLLAQTTRQAASRAYHDYRPGRTSSASNDINNHTQQQHHYFYHAAPTSNGGGFLEDFGISGGVVASTTTNPLLSPQEQQQQQQPATRNGFVLLSDWRQGQQQGVNYNPRDAWGTTVANLDLFLSRLYYYYYHGGLVPIMCKGVVELVTLVLTCVLSVFLARHVHWQLLLQCTDEATCQPHFSDYLLSYPNSSSSDDTTAAHSWAWTIWSRGIVSLYVYIFSAYFLFSLWNFGQTVSDARQCQWIFEQRLGIPEHKLQAGAVEWDVICTKLMQLQASGEYRIAIPRGGGNTSNTAPDTTGPVPAHNNNNDTTTSSSSSTANAGATQSTTDATTEGNTASASTAASAATEEAQELDALMIAHRILRKENFLVALFNKGLLNLTVPWWSSGCGTRRKSSDMTDHNIFETFYCPTLEWSLYFCILNFMWNHKYHVRPAFYLDPQALSRRFVVCGVAHLIFMPFLLFFITLHFALQNAYDYKSTKQYLGPREWSPVAKWTFREFNELPHIFERRMAPSYPAAEDYLKLFTQSEVVTTVGRILVFCGGSCGAVLFVFAAMNDAILLHVKIADWNLLWYAGMVGIVYSIGKALLPNGNAGQPRRYVRNMYAEMDTALRQVATHTHYYPQVWQARGWDKNSTHKCFSAMFQYKAQLFVHQVMSAVLAPYILCVSLPQCSEAICEFVLAVKTELPAEAGEVCGFATFDFDMFRDETWEGRTMGRQAESSVMTTGSLSDSILRFGQSVQEATRQHPKPQARHGKMEKSFFSFKAAHPHWKCPASGQHLVDRVEHYRREETAAITREQQLHMEAAARQLETLARLERENGAGNNNLGRPMAYHAFSSGVRMPLNVSGVRMPLNVTVDEGYYIPKTPATADLGAGTTFPAGSSPKHEEQPLQSFSNMSHAASATAAASTNAMSSSALRVPPPEAFSRLTTESEGVAVSPLGLRQQQQQSPRQDHDDSTTPFAIPATNSPGESLLAIPPQPATDQHRHSAAFLGQASTPTSSHRYHSSSLMQQHQLQLNSNAALSMGLSSELRRILNMSTLDPDVSLLLGGVTDNHHQHSRQFHPLPYFQEDGDEERQRAEQQYLLLERYHAHVAAQQGQVHQSISAAVDTERNNGGGSSISGSSVV